MKAARVLAVLALLAPLGQAHIGSPDIFLEGKAGAYQLFVTVRPPLTIPGVAELEVRAESPGIREMRAVPLAIAGAGAQFAPVPDKLKVSAQDPQFFTGSLWMMASGSWQVRITVDGAQGTGELAVPVPSVARATTRMQFGLGALLSVLGLFLVAGLIAMIGAGSREGALDPGIQPHASDVRRSRIMTAIGAVIVLAIVWGGNVWWDSEAGDYSQRIYKPLSMQASLAGGTLSLKMVEPGWMQPNPLRLAFRVFIRRMDDLVLDHGHLMHLYAIRQPGLDVVYHLHPDQVESGLFRLELPTMQAGSYKLYADIVHANGFPETMVTSIDLPAITGRALAGDDASGTAKPWQQAATSDTTYVLPDGYKIEWLRGNAPLRARQASPFRFRLVKGDGTAAQDVELYMGMLGHAAFVKTDGTVFAHIHPNGSVSMAALMMAQGSEAMGDDKDKMDMPMSESLPDEVTFPYGFPTPGRYRIFVQMKHGGTVETGVFDADVT